MEKEWSGRWNDFKEINIEVTLSGGGKTSIQLVKPL